VLIKSVGTTVVSKDRDNDHGPRVFPRFGNAAYAFEGYAIQRTPARKTPKGRCVPSMYSCGIHRCGWRNLSLGEAREVAGPLHSSVIIVPAIVVVVVDILNLNF
jgi:hypothetical protein